ncbi:MULTISPECIES: hypothetical protein [Chryseobacterium]|uniref:Uncharacterized protein n=1 Tax=Chryseobacterium camelliae TaxID=1265445 RepID=A0ABU0TLX6_9FLAO|nr:MULTISPECIES: hypothetical protein [Chryseobacterium]MDT3408143.1 hypothetical protein [Pseudacidovorax intermedius]MDQ1098001.1 hypothetical protein [Chryseobacterium camelliae]MDQ1101930.1 hypothetical protein [Chryseobacterium sp. SORGH_AS_1048]MDR6085370.1 hypothetical protein [Chryseobacterium sp. SORGH_AS_0909]MDR6129729.1 hypothetical protein [Chryseobacterium sp. SORGH_AS_1175]
MRNVFFGTALVLFALLSCRSDEDSIQNIDQILDIYIKNSAGQDLLNAKKNGSFSGYTMTDLFGTIDNAPVNNTLKVTADSLYYIEYIAGARRITLDSVSPDNRTYHSRIALALRRTQNNVTDTINDTLEIQYRWTPSVFEVSKVYYNKNLKFTKQPGSPNVVTIIK